MITTITSIIISAVTTPPNIVAATTGRKHKHKLEVMQWHIDKVFVYRRSSLIYSIVSLPVLPPVLLSVFRSLHSIE